MSLISTSENSTSGGQTASVTTIGTSFSNSSTLLVSVTPNNSSSGNYSFTLTLTSTIDGSIVGNQSEPIDAEIQVGFFQCRPGTYQGKTGSGSCDSASPGRYVSSTGATSEDTCSPGSYQPLSGQTSCIQASQGYYVSQTGSSSRLQLRLETSSPNLEQPPKHNAVRKLSAFVRTGKLHRRVCRELCCDIRLLQSNCLLAWDIPAF